MSAHHEKDHPFHLVEPSPWPLVVSLALGVMAIGGVMLMHDKAIGSSVFFAGIIGVLFVAFMWWRDVIREAIRDKAHTPPVQHGLRLGMALFIASEVMFFAAFFWAYFHAALEPNLPLTDVWPAAEAGVWPPSNIKAFDPWDLPFLNTLILLLSGTTVTWAHYAVLHNDRSSLVRGLGLTVLLGLSFTALQAVEYGHAAFGFTDGVYASTFYMATGFHGLHVIIGTIFLAVCWLRAASGQMDADNHLGLEFAAWYWHFVDVVWLFLFVSVYCFGS